MIQNGMFLELVHKIGFKSRIFRDRPAGISAAAQFPCGFAGSLLSCIPSCIFPKMRAKPWQNGCCKTIRTIEDIFAFSPKHGQPPRKIGDEPACFDHHWQRFANGSWDSKCDRALTAPPEFKSLMLRHFSSQLNCLRGIFVYLEGRRDMPVFTLIGGVNGVGKAACPAPCPGVRHARHGRGPGSHHCPAQRR